uniref:Uncharacterized protein n=1 Tax=Rhizophora mucronata TaxID=61149 RepID=A0A2P2IVB9_RHIMU
MGHVSCSPTLTRCYRVKHGPSTSTEFCRTGRLTMTSPLDQ